MKAIDRHRKINKKLMSFLQWCEDMNYYSKNESYVSPTQLSTRITDKARAVKKEIEKIK